MRPLHSRFFAKTSLYGAAFFALIFVLTLPAQADIIIATGNIPQIDENVLLNTGLTGNPIFGTTNVSGLSVRFSSDEDLTAPANGQARIEAADGTLDQLTVDLPNYYFTSLILNIDAAADGSVHFVVTEDNSQQLAGTFALGGNGENFFTITAINGQRISNVFFSTDVNMTLTNVGDVAQVRIGGAQAAVPEPATLSLLGGGLAGLAAAARRRLRK